MIKNLTVGGIVLKFHTAICLRAKQIDSATGCSEMEKNYETDSKKNAFTDDYWIFDGAGVHIWN